jgi:hypothetical protein
MYQFMVVDGSCGSPYDLAKAQKIANEMAQKGFVLAHVYQSTSRGCFGANAALVMIFRMA